MAPIKPAASRKFPRKAGALRCILAKAAPSIARAVIRTRRFGRALQNQSNASVSRSLRRRATRVAAGLVRAVRWQAGRRGRGRVERRESSLPHFTPQQYQTAGIAPPALQPGVGGDANGDPDVHQSGDATASAASVAEKENEPPVAGLEGNYSPPGAFAEAGTGAGAGAGAGAGGGDSTAVPSDASFDECDAAVNLRDRELIQEEARLYERRLIELRKLQEKHIAISKATETPSEYYREQSRAGVATLFESDLPGVYWGNSRTCWRATCYDETGKLRYLGNFLNIFDAYGARLDFLEELRNKNVDISGYPRAPEVEENLARLRREEEDRINAGWSITICCYVDCIRGKLAGCNGLCASHNGLLSGAVSYDMGVAMSLQAKGHRIIILDGAYRVPGSRSLAHAPDGVLAPVYYDRPDHNGMIGHQVILCNDGNGHDNERSYPTETESDNAHSMIALAKGAKLYAVLLRHEYTNGVRTPLPQTKGMLNSWCNQLGENARPGRSMLVYSYNNRHSDKALQRYDEGGEVSVEFGKISDESTWNLGVRQVA